MQKENQKWGDIYTYHITVNPRQIWAMQYFSNFKYSSFIVVIF